MELCSEKATKNDKIFTVNLTVKISSIFVAFLENMNFKIVNWAWTTDTQWEFFFSNIQYILADWADWRNKL